MSLSEKALKIKENTIKLLEKVPSEGAENACLFVPVLAALYGAVMNLDASDPQWEDRDRLIMGAWPCRVALYAALAESGFFPEERLIELYKRELRPGLADDTAVPGIDAVAANPGSGLALAIESALKARAEIKIYRSFLLIDQTDCLRGALWENAILASESMLDDLTVILCRKAGDILPGADNIFAKFSAFGFDTLSVDGENPDAVALALLLPRRSHKPLFVCCDVK